MSIHQKPLRFIFILLSLLLVTSCAQNKTLTLNGSWSAFSHIWNGGKEITTKQQTTDHQSLEAKSITPTNAFLVGLSDREIHSIKREAWSKYGMFWRGVATRSRYVRQPLIEMLKEAGAPLELQMVPVVESSYDPYVVSSVGATGLWQLMPETADDMHVKSDRYFDGRRDIRSSTKGAAKYLTKQYRRFGNWPMAFAAYHLGPSAVQRRLDRRAWKPEDGLKALPLPPITKTYIRHIIGLIALHEAGEISFPEPFPTTTMTLQTPIDLAQLHEKSKLPKNQIFRFNPQLKLNQYYDGKQQTLELRISQIRVNKVQMHLPSEPAAHLTVVVAKGESMNRISKRFSASLFTLVAANPGIRMWPEVGTHLRIPVELMRRIHPQNNPMVKHYQPSIVEVALNK